MSLAAASSLPRAAAFENHLLALDPLFAMPSPESESSPRRSMASADPLDASSDRIATAFLVLLGTPSPASIMSARRMPAFPYPES